MNSSKDKINLVLETQNTAIAVRESVGISYRQINNWGLRGVLPRERSTKTAWHKFTGLDIVVLSILKSLADFGVPINKLKGLSDWLHRPKTIESLVKKMFFGLEVYLFTDLRDTYAFYSHGELGDIKPTIIDANVLIIPLNKIVEDTLEKLGAEKDLFKKS